MITMRCFLFAFLFAGASLPAQNAPQLPDLLDRVRRAGPAAQIAASRYRADQQDFAAFSASLLPQVGFSANFPGLSRSIIDILQDDGSLQFVRQNLAFSGVNVFASQLIPLTGGSVTLGSSVFNRLNLDDTDASSWRTTPVFISYNQPIFQLNPIRWQRQQQQRQLDLAQAVYLQARETAAREAAEAYFDLLEAQLDTDIAALNVRNNDTIYRIAQGRFGVGSIAENDLLQTELNLLNAQADLEAARLRVARTRRSVELQVPELQLGGSRLSLPAPPAPLSVSPAEAARLAPEFAAQLRAAELAQLTAARDVAEAKQALRPSADLTASFGLNQVGNSLKEAYQNPSDQQQATVALNVPIYGGGQRRAELSAAQQRFEAARLAQRFQAQALSLDVQTQVENLALLAGRLARAARTDTIARRRYRLARQRYLVGKVDLQTLFIAQNERDTARRQYLATLRQYWITFLRLREQTLYDFVAGMPIGR